MVELVYLVLAGFIVIHVATAVLVARRLRRPVGRLRCDLAGEPVVVIVPIAGLPATGAATALTALRLAGPGVEIVYCAFDESEPVVAPIRAALAAEPAIGARLITGRARISRNPKLDNIEKGYAAAQADLVMMVDGNVEIDAGLAERAIALFDARTGLVSAVPIAIRPEGFAAVVECAFLNTLYARWQLFSDEVGLGFAHGKLLLLRRSLIDRAGGFAALASNTAEDCSASKMAWSLGLRVRILGNPVAQPVGRRKLSDVGMRFLRWAQLRRESLPVLYGFEFLMTPAIPAALAAAAAAGSGLSPVVAILALLALWYGVEFALAWVLGWPCPPVYVPACFVRDILALAIWPIALVRRGYTWRGETISGARGSSTRGT
jgi:ceramide glucosyltransferase